MPTLYQKYRPQCFADLIDQQHITQTITNEIKNNTIAHAYLFFGARGIGKTTLARLLAKAINCEKRADGQEEPCNQCTSCTEITAGRHIDVIEIDAASHTGVDNVRENIIENAQFRPTKAKYKVFIIDEVHMLSNSAFNALLKTIEEPPKYVVFILATTEARKLPATVVSRCQRFAFKKISYEQMLKRLEKICDQEDVKVEEKVLQRIINKSDGALRDAESLLGQILSLNQKNIGVKDIEMILPTSDAETVLRFISTVFDGQTKECFSLLDELTDGGVNLDQFAHDVIEVLRLMMITQNDPNYDIKTDYNATDIKTIKKLATVVQPQRLVQMIEGMVVRKLEIKSCPIAQLPLELFVVNFTIPGTEQGRRQNDREEKKANQNDYLDTKPNDVKPIPDKNATVNLTANKVSMTDKIKEKISSIGKKPINITLQEVKTKWDEIIEKVKTHTPSLGFILKMGELTGLEKNGLLTISVPYSIHQEKLCESAVKKLIETNLAMVLEEKITLNCVVSSSINAVKQCDQELNSLAADFGGEVVE